MPQLDKTGPEGKGPTGLGRGGCKQTSLNPQGRGAGRGRGRDFCSQYEATAPLSLTDEEKILKERLVEVQEALKEEESA